MGLVKRGHNVTRLVPGDIKKQKPILGRESTEGVVNILGASSYKTMLLMYVYAILTCEDTYRSKGLQQLLDYPKGFKFDATVIDVSLSGCLLPLIKRFNFPPSVGASPYLFPYYLALEFGSTIDHSYIPGTLVSLSDDMNFFERLTNFSGYT
nr:unnamed protein product [Callosobruchus chinensis]